MKRYFYLAAAIAGLLIAASCQKEGFEGADGDYVDVSFTTEIPSGVATKAIADGLTVNTLYYEIYEVTGEDDNGTPILAENAFIDEVTEIHGGSATISARLQKNKTYTAIFWAQYDQLLVPQDDESYYAYSPYNVENLTEVKVSYEYALANDETRDAFYAVVENITSCTVGYEVELKRPFAQVNVATSDYNEIPDHEINNIESSLTITNVATTFNTLTAQATDDVTATFATAPSPQGYLNDGYKYLAMAYVLVPNSTGDETPSISTISSEIKLNGVDEPIKVGYEGATLKQNHRTNLIGNILTGYTNFYIEVENSFVETTNIPFEMYEVDCEATLLAAINDETTATYKNINLIHPVTVNNPISITEGQTIVLNLNGKTLTNNVTGNRAFKITGDNVTFIVNAEGSNVEFGNGTFGMIELVTGTNNATVKVNGGTFTGTTNAGAFIRYRSGNNNNSVTLTNVNYTDNCEVKGANTNNAYVISSHGAGVNSNDIGNSITVTGGCYKACGMIADGVLSALFDGVTFIGTGTGFELKNGSIKNCDITLSPGAYVYSAEGAPICANNQGTISVEKTKIKSSVYGLVVYTSGGTINANEIEITAEQDNYYIYDGLSSGKFGKIIVDGAIVAEKYNNN